MFFEQHNSKKPLKSLTDLTSKYICDVADMTVPQQCFGWALLWCTYVMDLCLQMLGTARDLNFLD